MYRLKNNSIFIFLAVTCFIISGVAKWHVSSSSRDLEAVTSAINENINQAIERAHDQFVVLEGIDALSLGEFDFSQFEFGVFGYEDGSIVTWSGIEFVPEYRHVRGSFTSKFIRTVRDDYIALKKKIGSVEWVVTIPVHHDYKIENNYFQSSYNVLFFPGQELRLVNKNTTEYTICYQEECFFSIEYFDSFQASNVVSTATSLALFAIGFLFLIIFLFRFSEQVSKQHFWRGLTSLLLCTFLVRYLMLEVGLPNGLLDHPLFDSREFASSLMNASFADLFVNLVILLTISTFLFRNWSNSAHYQSLSEYSNGKRIVFMIVYLGSFVLLFHWIFLLFQTIYHNSQVSFDINNSVEFDTVRLAAYLAYLIFAICIILMSHVAFKCARQLSDSKREIHLLYLLTIGLFAIINIIIGQSFIATVIVSSVLFSSLLISGLGRSFGRITYASFLYLFVIYISISVLGSWAIFDFENEREVEKKKKYGTQFLIDNDHMAEYLLSVINEKIKNDDFIKRRLASPFLSKDIVASKIRQVYLNNYFDKYDIDIFIYDVPDDPLKESIDQGDYKIKLDVNKFTTGYDGIYFINLPEMGASKRYLNYIEIKRRGLKVGYVVIDMKLKRIVPDNVYPEMLVDNRFLSPYQNANYSYAVFNDNEVGYSSGNFNYNADFISESQYSETEVFDYNGFRHVAINDQAGHRVVISSSNHPLTDVVSNFSFLFLLKIIILLLIIGSYAFYSWYQKSELTYTARIQLYMNGAFFLPLFAVSITTLSLINATFEKELIEDYYKTAEDVGNNLSTVLSDYTEGITNADELKETVADISKFASADINVFGVEGKLLATNQPAIYDNELLSKFVNPEAYRRIVVNGEKAYTAKESVGSLDFNATYFGIKSFASGNLIGVVSIPFFDSEYALEQSQILVITNIINVFAFVFISFLVISYFATEWLTFPLTFITQKLKRTSLTEFNEPLIWNANDEIGLMVSEYNRMLVNLEDSKRALARSEKQSAWREIAKQVAHEIKNPLTPMKLTLQHLSRKLSKESDGEERAKPINSLLKQIDTLDDIASSFSSFAQMPIPESEKYELTSVVRDAVNLHLANQNTTIHLHLPEQEVYTTGDKKLMGRITSNLLLNAIQSSDKEGIELNIYLELKSSKILLSVVDNGDGIAEDIRPKIFIPNFTTKDTGSGIGLAIAKHGIEHAGGKIWFETDENEGTTFYIELLREEE